MKFASLILGLILLATRIAYHASGQDNLPIQAYEVRWTGRWISATSSDGLWLFDAENLEADPGHYFPSTRIVVVAGDPVRNRMAVYDEMAHRLLIIEPTTGDIITEIPTDFAALGLDEPEPARDLRYSDDGKLLALVFPSRIILYNATTSRERTVYQNDLYITIDSDVESGVFVAGTGYGDFITYRPDGNSPHLLYATGASEIYRLEILPATSEVIYQQGSTLMRTDLEVDEVSQITTLFDAQVSSFDLNDAGDTVAVALWNKTVLYDLATNAIQLTIEEDGSSFSLSFNDDGTQLVTLNEAGSLRIWDVVTGELLTDVYKFDYGSSVWAG